jgi:hypothetical protein
MMERRLTAEDREMWEDPEVDGKIDLKLLNIITVGCVGKNVYEKSVPNSKPA